MKSESEAKNAGLSGGSTRHRKAMTWAIILVALVVALILILPATAALAAPVVKEGSTPTGTTATGSSITFSHTSGSSANRLLLVGISWNCGTTSRTISSVHGTAGRQVAPSRL